ncbi:MAG: thiamine phosphate synthase [Reichenbachiella sp.]
MIAKLHYISQGNSPAAHLDHIQQACESGAQWVQLRLKDLDQSTVLATAEKAREITSQYQAQLIINDHYKIAKAVKADGIHLGKNDTCPTVARPQLYDWQCIGGTANTLTDCQSLIARGVEYIGLGPFRFTTTKDNLSPILGLEGYTKIIDKLKFDIPIIAIGGIVLNDVKDLLETGVYGIAASREITKDFTLIHQFNQVLNTPSSQQVEKHNQKIIS